ncbi:TetR/AcrR family transcriptional regulator [Frigidibacter sp. MR17.14]|uniref:TetR/AcrR family transcriptional regulator n=1 Tax=Frigidibacter sp. MR17.14 TaxID=3126509 RepID=UPI003012F6B5
MGRRRSIDRETLMTAIEQVVRQHGLSGLSIDAVAREAGISKSSVIYDFENKAALLAEFTRSRIGRHRAAQAEACAAAPEGRDRWLRGLLDCARKPPSDDDVATAMILSAGVAAHDECRAVVRDCVTDDLERITAEAGDKDAALLAYLAFFGLKSLEHFGFREIDPAFRNRCLDLIGAQIQPDAAGGAEPVCPAGPPSSEGIR